MNIMKNRKEDVIFVAVLLVLILVFVVFKIVKGKKVEAPAVDTVATVQTVDQKPQPKKAVIIKQAKPENIVWPELSYSEEFAKYQNSGRLIQFNASCQVFPATMVMVNGSSVMLDNRSKNEQIITLGDNKYTIAPYDFEIMTISAVAIPTTFLIDCNDRQNVATLIVE
jgi:hypothetical protein